jgi:Septum formation
MVKDELDGESDTADAESVSAAASPSTTEEGLRLEHRSYEPGDCVYWDEGGAGDVVTEVVDCSQPHRVQIAEEVDGPEGEDYPSPAAWDAFLDNECRAAAERYLGFALDPHGRITPYGIMPLEDSWSLADRRVWCGVSIYQPGAPEGTSTEDAHTAEQAFHHAVGDCISVPPDGSVAVVACDQPHHMEITARADFGDLASLPADDQIGARCQPTVDAYLGHPPVEPWRAGHEGLVQPSWDAGTRTAHCFVGQFDAAGNLIAVTGSARG